MPSKAGNEYAFERRERKRAEAEERQAARDDLGDAGQLSKLKRKYNLSGKEAQRLLKKRGKKQMKCAGNCERDATLRLKVGNVVFVLCIVNWG